MHDQESKWSTVYLYNIFVYVWILVVDTMHSKNESSPGDKSNLSYDTCDLTKKKKEKNLIHAYCFLALLTCSLSRWKDNKKLFCLLTNYYKEMTSLLSTTRISNSLTLINLYVVILHFYLVVSGKNNINSLQ